MVGITLAQAEARLTDYLAAEEAVLAGQSYTIQNKSVTRADLQWIQEGIKIWDQRVKNLSTTSGGKRYGGIPVD